MKLINLEKMELTNSLRSFADSNLEYVKPDVRIMLMQLKYKVKLSKQNELNQMEAIYANSSIV